MPRSTRPPSGEIALVAVLGGSPAVITETLYALLCGVPDDAHTVSLGVDRVARLEVITTVAGARSFCECLADPEDGTGAIRRLGEAHGLSERLPAWSTDVQVHVPLVWDACKQAPEDEGEGSRPTRWRSDAAPHGAWLPVQDIRGPEESQAFEALCCTVVARLKAQGWRVVGSLAGGRKTMSVHLALAMSLYGSASDALVHTLVEPPDLEQAPWFFFPEDPGPTGTPAAARRGASGAGARVLLVPVAFARTGAGGPSRIEPTAPQADGELLGGAPLPECVVPEHPALRITDAARQAASGPSRPPGSYFFHLRADGVVGGLGEPRTPARTSDRGARRGTATRPRRLLRAGERPAKALPAPAAVSAGPGGSASGTRPDWREPVVVLAADGLWVEAHRIHIRPSTAALLGGFLHLKARCPERCEGLVPLRDACSGCFFPMADLVARGSRFVRVANRLAGRREQDADWVTPERVRSEMARLRRALSVLPAWGEVLVPYTPRRGGPYGLAVEWWAVQDPLEEIAGARSERSQTRR